MFLSRNKKNNVYPCKPHFYYIKVGFKGVKIILVCFRDGAEASDLDTEYNSNVALALEIGDPFLLKVPL